MKSLAGTFEEKLKDQNKEWFAKNKNEIVYLRKEKNKQYESSLTEEK